MYLLMGEKDGDEGWMPLNIATKNDVQLINYYF